MEVTGQVARYGAMSVAAYRGDEAETSTLIQATLRDVSLRGEGLRITAAEWANAALHNGLGKYQEALAAAQRATENSWEMGFSTGLSSSWSRLPPGARWATPRPTPIAGSPR